MVREFIEGWDLLQVLGEGTFAEVKLLVNRDTGEACAMKEINIKENLIFSFWGLQIVHSKVHKKGHSKACDVDDCYNNINCEPFWLYGWTGGQESVTQMIQVD